MTRVVVNRCYGGFGLSHEAMLRYAELKGLSVYPQKQSGYYLYWLDPIERKKTLYESDIERDDEHLVQVVEEMGEAANGDYAELSVVEIPDDVQWQIDEYDGMETVEEAHRSW